MIAGRISWFTARKLDLQKPLFFHYQATTYVRGIIIFLLLVWDLGQKELVGLKVGGLFTLFYH